MSCVVCGSDSLQPLYRPKHSPGPVVRCADCGLVLVYPIQDERALIRDGPVLAGNSAELLASTDLTLLDGCWEKSLLACKQAEWPAVRRNALDALRHIDQHLRPPGRLLDFGCGGGFFLGVARELGWEPFGLEPLPGQALHARARFRATVVADTLREDTFPPGFFDVITAFQVFEHLPDPVDVLRKLKVTLRPGGLLLIEVPNIDTWSVRLLGRRHRHFVQDHVMFFSQRTLSRLLACNGFEVVDVYYPARCMTLRHLVFFWGARCLGVQPATRVRGSRIGLLNRVVTVRLHDIVAVVGRRASA